MENVRGVGKDRKRKRDDSESHLPLKKRKGQLAMLSTRDKLLEEPPLEEIASTSTAYLPPDSDTAGVSTPLRNSRKFRELPPQGIASTSTASNAPDLPTVTAGTTPNSGRMLKFVKRKTAFDKKYIEEEYALPSTQKFSYICVFDLESALKKSPGAYGVETIHESIAYCYIIIDGEGKRVASSHYCGNDCVDNFLLDLSDCWAAIRSQRKTFPIDMSTEDERTFQQQTVCQMCKTSFKHDRDKHRHHDHAEPKNNFIGAYCTRCNLACRELKTRLPIFAHNSSYDLGLILKELKTKVDITIMTKQGLKIQRMTVGNLVFLDSLAFLGSSLDSLASEYFRDGRKAGLTEDMLSEIRDDKLPFLHFKWQIRESESSPFCYDYIDSLAKLKETHFPPKTAFYNKLRERDISEEEYKRAQRVWDISKCKTLKNFLLLYLIVDTALLGDILIWWRFILYDKYGLDLPHYVSLPSYAFDSFLKMSEIELDHVYDEEFVLEHEGRRMTVKCKKLMATHHSKKEYLISLPLLQLYMDLGLELEVVHSIYEFSQSAYMKDFIKTNIEARSAATSSTEKKPFKAMSNCVFGKTLLNPLKYAEESKVVNKASTYLQEAQNPRLKLTIHLSEDRIICTSTLPQVIINMPNYIGFAILESAKFDLYYFFYKVLKNNYGDKVKLLYTDTDSFLFALEVDDLNSELAQEPLKSYMDFSNFDVDHPLFSNERKGELGLLTLDRYAPRTPL
ncbi:uncharacterized protein [Palaemon carinicauda]|uniref:uncharacterized protein n=1 Tax=Palaemon carinicauda TaxID=392227 RepID=UPI0035B5AF67